jgi:hypothetical protein
MKLDWAEDDLRYPNLKSVGVIISDKDMILRILKKKHIKGLCNHNRDLQRIFIGIKTFFTTFEGPGRESGIYGKH